jgi:histidine ammonia-lyase
MLAQYTAASIVSDHKVLAHPASVDTIPTSGNQEDHVSMGWGAARKLREIVVGVRSVLAVEFVCAAQGIDLRADIAAPGRAIAAVQARLRAAIPRMDIDREVGGQLVTADALLPELVAAAESVTGALA